MTLVIILFAIDTDSTMGVIDRPKSIAIEAFVEMNVTPSPPGLIFGFGGI